MPIWIYAAMALCNGVFSPIQAGCNARAARAEGNPVLAAMTNTTISTLTLLTIALAIRPGLPAASELLKAPWWAWCGGLMGSMFVLGNLFLAPKLGSASLVGMVLCGQLITSITLDHFGLVGFEKHPINGSRILGALFLLVGIALIRRS